MIKPNEVAEMARKKEEENYAFRTYLKIHANPSVLDRQFQKLHRELIAEYDCNACRNCCRQFRGNLMERELSRCASKLDLSRKDFAATYLRKNQEGTYDTLHVPCDFLREDGSCLFGKDKPKSCKDYPFTDRPDRMGSLLGIVENSFVCPVVFEMLERLKEEYGFHCDQTN